jgi:hypothetical protein
MRPEANRPAGCCGELQPEQVDETIFRQRHEPERAARAGSAHYAPVVTTESATFCSGIWPIPSCFFTDSFWPDFRCCGAARSRGNLCPAHPPFWPAYNSVLRNRVYTALGLAALTVG